MRPTRRAIFRTIGKSSRICVSLFCILFLKERGKNATEATGIVRRDGLRKRSQCNRPNLAERLLEWREHLLQEHTFELGAGLRRGNSSHD